MRRTALAPILLAFVIGLSACAPREPSPEALVAEARAAHGSARLDSATVRFGFRGDCYTLARDGGALKVARVYRDTVQGATGPYPLLLQETYGPSGVGRTLLGAGVALPAPEGPDAAGIETRLNSIAYFAQLPYNLTDAAAIRRRLPDALINGQPYKTVEVTFAQAGGGRDWEDRFVYWFHRDRHTLDYLAYLYHTGEGGTRFRVATNPRTVGGVRWQDYENYTDPTLGARIEAYPAQLGAPTLTRVSDVVLEEVEVGPPEAAGTAEACTARLGTDRR